jgi:SAM-dependent methyltransferase
VTLTSGTTSATAGAPKADALRLQALTTAYLSSKALFAAVELGLFDALEEQPGAAEEIGRRLKLPERPARMLLLAMHGLGLVRCEAGTYSNEPVASRHLVSSGPEFMGPLIAHQDTHYGKFTQLTTALRTDTPVRAGDNYSGAFGGEEQWARRWAEIMRAASLVMAEELAASTDLANRRKLVDLGCGSGAYSVALARANAQLDVTAVDQPAICEAAQDLVNEAGLQERVHVRPANVFEEEFPDHDVALLSHVIQGFNRDVAQTLIRKVHSWLPAGGELLVHTHLPERASTPFPYLFGLILLINNTQGGEAHGEEITRAWLVDAGFEVAEVRAVSPISAVIRAVKPALESVG